VTAFESLSRTPPAGLEPWQVEFAGLRLGPGTPYDWRTRSGFDELPELRTDDMGRTWAHGVWTGDDYAEGRTLAWELLIDGTADIFAELVGSYRRVMVPRPPGVELLPLWSHEPGRGVIRWDVKVRRHALPEDPALQSIYMAQANAQLLAPDPIGYGPGQVASTGFAREVGGLEFDLFTDGQADTGYLEFGEVGNNGRNRVTNPGSAPLWVAHRVTGPTPAAGFEIVDTSTGERLRYADVVPAGSTLDIDTAEGSAILDGVADRSGRLTVAEWGPVPARGDTEFAFIPLSAATGAVLQTAFAPAWW
jgi:hypothetical protein